MADLASLYIKVDSKGVVTASKDLDNLTGKSKSAEKATKSVTRSFSKLQAVVVALASSYALLKIAQYVKETALLAARYETLGVVMRVVGNNAGYTAVQMDKFALGLQKTGIAMVESRNTLARMIQAQIDLTSSQKLARIAQDAAVIGAMNSSEAFEHMIYGLQTGHPRILRTIGLNVDFDKSVRALADSLGIKKDALSEAQIMQGRVNAVMKAGVLITGTYEAAMTTAGKKIASFTRYVQDFKVKMGEAFGSATVILVDAVTTAMKEMQDEISKPEAQEALRNLSTQLAIFLKHMLDLAMVMGKIIKLGVEFTNVWVKTWQAMGLASIGIIDLNTALFDGVAALETFNEALGPEKLRLAFLERVIATGKYTSKVYWEAKRLRELIDALPDIDVAKPKEVALAPGAVPVTEVAPKVDDSWIKRMQAQEKFALEMAESEQVRLNERHELEKEINAKIHDELLSDTAFRLQELDSQFLTYDGFVKNKAALDEWYVKQYEEIMASKEQVDIDSYSEMTEAEKSWIDGAKSRLEDYARTANDVFGNIKDLTVNALMDMEDALVEFCMTGKLNFKDFANSIIKDLIRILIQKQITGAIAGAMSGWLGGGTTATPMGGTAAGSSTGMTSTTPTMAKGGIFSSGLSSHSNTIVDTPTFFSFAKGTGLMGEAGPEAIMPLTPIARMPGGELGIKTLPGRPPVMIVNIHEAPGTQTRVEQSEDGQSLEVIIEQVEQSMQDRMNRGTGMAPFMDSRYGRAY